MIRWSYSALNQFETCPAQFAAERIFKTVERTTNEQSIWGNEVHEALEHRLRSKQPLSERFKDYEHLAVMVEKLEGDKFYEHEIALNKDRRVTTWDAKDVWLRSAILDVLIVNNETAIIIDWKTGKVKDNTLQLQLYALCVFAAFPRVEVVHTLFQWIAYNQVTRAIYHRYNTDELWKPFFEKVKNLQDAQDLEIWNPKPSGLCIKHCNNVECEFHGVGNRRY